MRTRHPGKQYSSPAIQLHVEQFHFPRLRKKAEGSPTAVWCLKSGTTLPKLLQTSLPSHKRALNQRKRFAIALSLQPLCSCKSKGHHGRQCGVAEWGGGHQMMFRARSCTENSRRKKQFQSTTPEPSSCPKTAHCLIRRVLPRID